MLQGRIIIGRWTGSVRIDVLLAPTQFADLLAVRLGCPFGRIRELFAAALLREERNLRVFQFATKSTQQYHHRTNNTIIVKPRSSIPIRDAIIIRAHLPNVFRTQRVRRVRTTTTAAERLRCRPIRTVIGRCSRSGGFRCAADGHVRCCCCTAAGMDMSIGQEIGQGAAWHCKVHIEIGTVVLGAASTVVATEAQTEAVLFCGDRFVDQKTFGFRTNSNP